MSRSASTLRNGRYTGFALIVGLLATASPALAQQAAVEPSSLTLNCQIEGESYWMAQSGTMPTYEADNSFQGPGSIRIDFANRNVTFNFLIAGDKSDRSGNGLQVEPGAEVVTEFDVFNRSQIIFCEAVRGCTRQTYTDGGNQVTTNFAPTVIDLERMTFSVRHGTDVRGQRGGRVNQTIRYNGVCQIA